MEWYGLVIGGDTGIVVVMVMMMVEMVMMVMVMCKKMSTMTSIMPCRVQGRGCASCMWSGRA